MRILFCCSLLFISFFLSAQFESTSIVPLGYDDESRHFLKKENKTAIYDVDQSKIVVAVDGLITKKEILDDRYLIYYKLFDKEKKLNLIDLQKGYVGDHEFSTIKKRKERIYGQIYASMDQYCLNQETNEWYETDEVIHSSSNVKGWDISMYPLKYKDFKIDKPSKSITVNATKVHYMNKCGPYLLYLPEREMLIDTSGNVVRVDKEVLKDNVDCFSTFNRIENFNDLVKEVYAGQEYKGLKRFKHNNNIYFQREDKKWGFRDERGEYHDLKYSNLLSRYNYLFGELKNDLYLLDEKHEVVMKVGNKYPRIWNRKYLYIKDDNAYYGLMNSKYLTPEQNDAVHMSKDVYGYKNGTNWVLNTFSSGKKVSIEADKINYSSSALILIELDGTYSLIDWDGNYLCKNNKEQIELYCDKLIYQKDAIGRSSLSYLNGKKVELPKIQNLFQITENIILINYTDYTVLDKNHKSLYKVPNLEDYNKLGISTYENNQLIFRDFDGNIRSKELDIYEEVKEVLFGKSTGNTPPEAPESYEGLFDNAIDLMDQFLVDHPTEYEILKNRIQFGLMNLKEIDHDLVESYISRIAIEHNEYVDLPIYKQVIRGTKSSSDRSEAIKNVEAIMSSPDFETRPMCIDSDSRYSSQKVLDYYLGYLYHLEGNVEKSSELKAGYFKILENQRIPTSIMSLY